MKLDGVQCDKMMPTHLSAECRLRLAVDQHARLLCLAPEERGETAGSNHRKWDPPGN